MTGLEIITLLALLTAFVIIPGFWSAAVYMAITGKGVRDLMGWRKKK